MADNKDINKITKKLVVCGGSAGHVFTAVQFAKNSHADLCVAKIGLKFCNITPKYIFNSRKSLWMILYNLLIFGPRFAKYDEIYLFGSYHCILGFLLGIILRKNIIIHEQNSVIGTANFIFSYFATKVLSSFKILNLKSFEYYGLPQHHPQYPEKETGIILVMSGSMGSDQMYDLLDIIYKFCLDNNYKLYASLPEPDKLAKVYPMGYFSKYLDNWEELIASANLIITHSGASTISYLHLYNKRAIIIPLIGSAHNHQIYNALFSGYKYILDQSRDTLTSFLDLYTQEPDQFLPTKDFFKNNIV